jgi:hypothetical protein
MFPIVSASAGSVDRCAGGSCVNGSISVHKDKINWNFTVKDNKKDGNCAYAKVIVDRNNLPDKESRSPNVCGEGKTGSFNGDLQYSGTRAARVEACVDLNNRPDSCTLIYNEIETN